MCKMLELTVTCFACGMPSSSLWARRVRRRRGHDVAGSAPFYPQLDAKDCPPGAVVNEDGTVHLCAFCFALLDSQQTTEEGEGSRAPGIEGGEERVNPILWKFVCGVCGVETYRKRVRALSIQKFQFLTKMRKPGSISITLGDSECAVVCLDCSETLWVQSDEYDRWGLPEHKRHFNWMARPPPPEDSEEANLARLPSGKSQLPRTPPTEPILPMSPAKEADTVQNFRHRQKKGKVSRPHRSSSVSSNSNSSSSNMQMDVDLQPQAKRKKMLDMDGSNRIMDQTLPHLESLDLSTRFSPPSSKSADQTKGLPQTLMAFPFPLQQYQSTVNPVPRIAYSIYPTTSTIISHNTSSRNHSPTNYPPSTSRASLSYGGGLRSEPIPIRQPVPHHHEQMYVSSSNLLRSAEMRKYGPELGIEDGIVEARYHHPSASVGRPTFQEQILHRPNFVYTARPPPTMMRDTDSYHYRFLARIPTSSNKNVHRIRVQNHGPGMGSQLIQRSNPTPTPPTVLEDSCPSSSRRFSVPVVVAPSTEGGGHIALLPKKRRSWGNLNKSVVQDVSVLKFVSSSDNQISPSKSLVRQNTDSLM